MLRYDAEHVGISTFPVLFYTIVHSGRLYACGRCFPPGAAGVASRCNSEGAAGISAVKCRGQVHSSHEKQGNSSSLYNCKIMYSLGHTSR